MQKVSVVMATHNRGWIIERAIKSILAQTYKDFELLILDDGSTDNTKEILKQFNDPRIHIDFLPKKKNLSVLLNIGVKKAQGELITYLDTDNVWYPTFLEVMVSEMTKNTVLAYSGQNLFLVGGTKEKQKIIARKIRNEPFNPVSLLKGNYIDINSVIHTKKILEEIGMFNENLATSMDWDVFVRIAIKHPFQIKFVNEVLGEYYYYNKSIADTLTNRYSDDLQARYWFGGNSSSKDDSYVLEKIQKQLKRK